MSMSIDSLTEPTPEHEASDPQTPLERLQVLAQSAALRPWIVRNPAAPSALLQSLADLGDASVRAAVAAHPNTSPDLLLSLAGEYPSGFCANPTLPLLLLEQPDLPAHMPSGVLGKLLCYAGVPVFILRWVAAHAAPAEAEAARLHIGLAGEAGSDWPLLARHALWKLTLPDYNDMLLELIALGAVPEWLIETLATVADREVRGAIARNSAMPRELLRPLRQAGASGDLQGYAPAAPTCHPELLSRLADGNTYARRVAARNTLTPASALAQLATDPDRSVRQGVAANPATSAALLARLAMDRSIDVRQLVARYAKAPQVLERLAHDHAHAVRFNVARNSNTPLTVLQRLAADPHNTVRQALTRHPDVPATLLDTLMSDPHPQVRAAAARRLGLPTQQATAAQPDQQRHLPQTPEQHAANAATTIDQLRVLAEHSSPRVRAAVARNPSTPLELLEWLADDESALVHCGVAQNPNTPAAILERFAKDPTWFNYRTRCAVAQHPNVTPKALMHMADDDAVLVRRLVQNNPLTPPEARQKLLTHSLDMCLVSSEAFYHAIALANPAVPADGFACAVHSPSWLVRFAAANNPNAPYELIQALCEDGNRLVRAAARSILPRVTPSGSSSETDTGVKGLMRYSVGYQPVKEHKFLKLLDSDLPEEQP